MIFPVIHARAWSMCCVWQRKLLNVFHLSSKPVFVLLCNSREDCCDCTVIKSLKHGFTGALHNLITSL